MAKGNCDPRDIEVIRRFQREPDWFCEQILGDTLWSKQREVLRALADNEKVAVASCHGVGKTWLASRAVLWFLHSFSPAIVATTAPTGHQVRNLLWREIRTAHGRLPADLQAASKCLTTELQFFRPDGGIYPDHLAWGRSTDEAAQFQGLHGPYLMAVVDEAAGVSDEIYEALDTWAAGGVYRELLIGNPTRAEGKFYRAFTNPALEYVRIQVPVASTPMWTGERVPERVRKLLVQPERVEQWKVDWGEGSAAYQARVNAKFPAEGAQAVIIPLAWVEEAKRRAETWQASDGDTLQVGVDVARFGEDHTCVASRVGMALVGLEAADGDTDAPRVAGMAAHAAMRLRDTYRREVLVVFDETGVGGGALDICRTRGDRDILYVGFHFGGAAIDNARRANAGAEAYWNLRDYAQGGNQFPDLVIACECPEVERFAAQVSARRYGYDGKGRVQLERKDDVKKRGLPSPDEADAVAMAFASVPMESTETVGIEDVMPDFGGYALGAARL